MYSSYFEKYVEIDAAEKEALLDIYESVAKANGFEPDYEDRDLVDFENDDALLDTVLYHVHAFGKNHQDFGLISDLFEDPEETQTRRLNVTIACQAVYNSGIDVPINLSFEDALKYAKEHIADIPLGTLDYISDSDVLDEENCDFENVNVSLKPALDSVIADAADKAGCGMDKCKNIGEQER